jgi:type I restriction enzyme, S subunit
LNVTAPKQWPTKRIRFVTERGITAERGRSLSQASQVTFIPMEAISEHGQLDLSAIRDVKDVHTGYTQFFDGDVLIAKITPCFENGKGAIVRGALGGVGFGTTELHVLTPTDEVDGRFLYYTTASDRFRKLGEACMTGAAGQKRVPEDFVRDFRISVPPLSLQCAIADYLDREAARLDALVAAKERVLGLLAEKRRALITRAVTRGLDPRAPLRDSGIPWLGEIPAHWDTERARWLFRERDERSTTGDEELLTVSHLTGVTPRSEKDVNMFQAETTEGYKICLAGDLVINTLWAWMGAMGVSPVNGIVSPAYNVYQPGARLEPGYVDALVRLPIFAEEVTRYSKGVWSSRLRLYPEGFFEVYLPVPPLREQREIVLHLAKETVKLDRLGSATERTIALIKERRAALITAAVTGQIDMVEATA